MSVLQDEQVKAAQQKLAHAGIRSKDAAVAVIFARMLLPIILGGGVCLAIYGVGWLGDWTPMKKFGVAAGALILSYKAPVLYVQNLITKRADAIRQGLPDAPALLVYFAEAGLTDDPAFTRLLRALCRAQPGKSSGGVRGIK